MQALQHILLGTAGHIDHGKTSLVRRLTGIDTDRLPEEKSRGISIDLGFAHWEAGGFQFGIVDVPGHERFVRNMVAGATGINLALLVVAADDGVMPQTREHLDVMELLGVRAGLVALTKTDLVEPGFEELVRAEVAELAAGTFLAGSPIVCVSSATGAGFDVLQRTIVELATTVAWPEPSPLFRMPIDRVFSLAGHGTVVTGSVLGGEVHAGDTVEVLPRQDLVRVRSVQSHGRSGDSGARRRTGINLAGVKTDALARGDELAAPGSLRPSQRMLVELRTLASAGVVKHRAKLRLHLGTRDVVCRVLLREGPLGPGGRAFAELRTSEPVVASWGQHFILRRSSPALTVAGGTILDAVVPPRQRLRDPAGAGAALASESELDRLSHLLSGSDSVETAAGPHAPAYEAAQRAGIAAGRYAERVGELLTRGDLVRLGLPARGVVLHVARCERLRKATLRAIREELARQQPRRALPRPVLAAACRNVAAPVVVEAVFDELIASKQLVDVGGNLGPADLQVRLTKQQQATLAKTLETITAAGLMPPLVRELAAQFGQTEKELAPLIRLLVEDGLVVPVDETLYVTPTALDQARSVCVRVFAEREQATMSELREAWGVTRKYSLPLCAWFDARGVMVREGDVRRAGPELKAGE